MPGAAAAGVSELLLTSFDPFVDTERGDDEDGGAPAAPRDDVVHLRTQQRNGHKSLTTVQGLSAAYNYAKILRNLKRELCCSGIVVEDEDLSNVVQLQGDHRKAVAAFLVKAGIVTVSYTHLDVYKRQAYNYAKILRDLKRELCCSGIVVEDEDLSNVVQLQGDHRKAVAAFLVKAGIVTKANVKIHGSNKITELVATQKPPIEMVLAELGGSIARALARMSAATVVDDKAFADCLNEISHALLQANVRFETVRAVQSNIKAVQRAVAGELCQMLDPGKPPLAPAKGKPSVVMFVGL
ncbi:Protein translation factor SUI1-like protein [Dichanthelium oligosanthes]|uniref:Protein translation factor SUI1-like protein n=1 Tax=Dichanthelium oligosanthes TaxID=888268 RepID=A0A1E5VBN8_9POAL|nr:Protein translation factor SUI1-like protein [Dichanthelium oligosanthes]